MRKVRGVLVVTSSPPVAFVVHPKTGSRSIVSALKQTGMLSRTGGRHRVEESVVLDVKRAGGIVVGSVRNPYDNIVSWFHHRLLDPEMRPRSWNEWLARFVTDGLPPWVVPGGRLFTAMEYLDELIWFEKGIGTQLNDILARVGLGPATVGHEGKTNHASWQDHYSLEQKSTVYDRFRQDFVDCGYNA